MTTTTQPEPHHICPWWIGYLLASPVRKLFHKPEAIVGSHVEAGMTVVDLGSAMGFFSVPMARRVGPNGRVICLDVQERMFRTLKKRAARAGVSGRIELRLCQGDDLRLDDLAGSVDFALAFAVLHEIPDQAAALGQLHAALAPGRCLLLAEPAGHVTAGAFEASVELARGAGFSAVDRPAIKRSHAALLRR